jgi:predicted metal-dependent hydrolase
VLKESRATKEYNKTYTYGTYQIDEELNTRYKNDNDEWIYYYSELNTAINSLKTKLAKYYEVTIQPKLFKYELLK